MYFEIDVLTLLGFFLFTLHGRTLGVTQDFVLLEKLILRMYVDLIELVFLVYRKVYQF